MAQCGSVSGCMRVLFIAVLKVLGRKVTCTGIGLAINKWFRTVHTVTEPQQEVCLQCTFEKNIYNCTSIQFFSVSSWLDCRFTQFIQLVTRRQQDSPPA